jgi:glycosyltransferase involved in cell wall biosynthesis
VDAFTAALPVFATDIVGSGPEHEYLEPEINGMMTSQDPAAYAAAVCRVLDDPGRLARMRDAARATAARLTLTHMVEAFATGIVGCLEARA